MELTKDQIDRLLKSDLANIVKKVLKGKPLNDSEIEHLKNGHSKDQTSDQNAEISRPEVPANDFPIWWETFADEYIKNGYNGTQAYLKAKPGVKLATANTESCLLLQNPKFRKVLKSNRQNATDKIEIDRIQWLNEMKDLAFAKGVKVEGATKHRALETLGRIAGFIQDELRMRHTFSPVDVAVTLAGMSRLHDNGKLATIEIETSKLLEAEILDDDTPQSSIP